MLEKINAHLNNGISVLPGSQLAFQIVEASKESANHLLLAFAEMLQHGEAVIPEGQAHKSLRLYLGHNILRQADNIVNLRAEEKGREYGDFGASMELMCELFNSMTKHKYNCVPKDMYLVMVAAKLSRQAHAHKEDNLLDAVAYLGALNNYVNKI